MSYAISRAPVKADDALIPLAPLGLTPDVLERAAARHAERARGLPKGSLVDAVKARQAAVTTLRSSSETDTIRYKPAKGDAGEQPDAPSRKPAGRQRKPAAKIAAEQWFGRIETVDSESFVANLPARPWCADALDHGLIARRKDIAARFKHIQFNHPARLTSITMDIDRPDAAASWADENLPPPNLVVVNPENGHAHLTWFLRAPVLVFTNGNSKPLAFYQGVQRGLCRRLRADPGYSGLISKNPLHPRWRTTWLRSEPYALSEIDQWLEFEDKAPVAKFELEIGIGRNVGIFNKCRKEAYRACVPFKVDGGNLSGWQDKVHGFCAAANAELNDPLRPNEIGHIAKSIAKWTWRRFSEGAVSSEAQRRRIAKRWAGHVKSEPWKEYGMSRATYFRRKKAGTLPLIGTGLNQEG